MNEKIPLYASMSLLVIIVKIKLLALLVVSICFVDIIFGVYLVFKLKEETFSFWRFCEGFFKMFIYLFLIWIASLIDSSVFHDKLFEIDYLVSKTVAMLFVIIETTSIDKKSVRLGNKPIVETSRDIVKVFKEFYKSIKSIFDNN